MELVFLSVLDLRVLDHALVSDYEIVIDSVIYQKSKFNVNRIDLKADIGDIVIVRGVPFSYIGIIETLTNSNEGYTEVVVNDYSVIFDVKVPVSSYSGDLGSFLLDMIKKAFVNNRDPLQNIDYLVLTKGTAEIGSLVYESKELLSITEVVETLAKSYGITLKSSIVIGDFGEIAGINVEIASVTKGMKIKANLPCINNLSIVDSNNQITNKVIYYPNDDNTSHRSEVAYYLLTDGTITKDANNSKRYPYVKSVSYFFSDNDYSALDTKAQSELLVSNLEHSIEFDIVMDNHVVVPFKNLHLGDYVEFITPKKTYQTMVTQLSFKSNFYECHVVLGEYRVKLTDKIKLLERK